MFTNRNRFGFHILPLSPWPLLTSAFAFFTVSNFSFYLHKIPSAWLTVLFSLIGLILCIFFWFADIVSEATEGGFHTKAVRMGIRLGFLLFIVSEIMLFFGFFWAFFHAALSPGIETGYVFPPIGIYSIKVFDFPLFNTFVLIISGCSVTWVHCAICLGYFKDAIDGFLITMGLGFGFILLQMYEYYEAAFSFNDSIYSCAFFMLTGLHGCHVMVGAFFLAVCFLRLLFRHYITTHYLGLVLAIWYWHFVDVVWIFLFFTVYCWGSY